MDPRALWLVGRPERLLGANVTSLADPLATGLLLLAAEILSIELKGDTAVQSNDEALADVDFLTEAGQRGRHGVSKDLAGMLIAH